ncbi:MAG: hypothetical protein J6O04_11560 [Selenomonadaceae bacterium]|nr:hypothetical protein [Selenomonadaceae bacterium]
MSTVNLVEGISNHNSSKNSKKVIPSSDVSYKDMLLSLVDKKAIIAKQEEILEKKREELLERIASQEETAKFNAFAKLMANTIVTTRKLMPDGTILITTKRDGEVISEFKKRPHMVSKVDPNTGKIELKPFISIFDMLAT